MGNITTLNRNENGSGLNQLSLAYTGNQLLTAYDALAVTKLYGSEAFDNKANLSTEYLYDTNGSTTYDANSGISTIQYNVLNLPNIVQFTAGHKNIYTYGADGKKLEANNYTLHSAINVPQGSISTLPSNAGDYTKVTTDYVGNMIYENGSLKEILLPEGYWQSGVYYYYLKDHLGDNRVTINSSGSIIEKSHYYPSGMRFGESVASGGNVQPYRHIGKEMQSMHGLNWYDNGARMRQVDIPVWTTLDPLAEKYYSISPYAYCAGNPVNSIDMNGDSIWTTNYAIVNNADGTTSIQTNKYYYGQDGNGNYGFIGSDGKIYSGNDNYINSLGISLGQLMNGGVVGSGLVTDLMTSSKNVDIGLGKNGADPNGTYIHWDPKDITGGFNKLGNQERPAFIGLGHEMAHIKDIWDGTVDTKDWIPSSVTGNNPILNAEKYATNIENQLRAENGITLRAYYGIDNSNGTSMPLTCTQLIDKNGKSIYYGTSYYQIVRVGNTKVRVLFNH